MKLMALEGTTSPFKSYKSRRNWTIVLKDARARNKIRKIRRRSVAILLSARYRREAVSLSCKFISPRPSVGYSTSDNLFTARQQASRSKKKKRRKREKKKIRRSCFPAPHTRASKCETCVTICGHSCESRGVL